MPRRKKTRVRSEPCLGKSFLKESLSILPLPIPLPMGLGSPLVAPKRLLNSSTLQSCSLFRNLRPNLRVCPDPEQNLRYRKRTIVSHSGHDRHLRAALCVREWC
jgi:hypothetical protein